MGLAKQTIEMSFGKGLDTKTDPNQVAIGKFVDFENIIFDELGALKKRNGFGSFTSISATNLSSLTTYLGSLVALGDTLNVYSGQQDQWISKGNVNQISLSTVQLVRSASSQTANDASVSFNGLVCTTWIDSDGN